MAEHTPYCDCSIMPAGGIGLRIDYCPLHAAAPAMLEALEGLRKRADGAIVAAQKLNREELADMLFREFFVPADKAIAQARGEVPANA